MLRSSIGLPTFAPVYRQTYAETSSTHPCRGRLLPVHALAISVDRDLLDLQTVQAIPIIRHGIVTGVAIQLLSPKYLLSPAINGRYRHSYRALPCKAKENVMSVAAISAQPPVTPTVAAPKSAPEAVPPKANASASAAQSKQAASVAVVNAATAALKEATETSAQTVKEAAKGDRQAQRLLTKETAANQVRNGGSSVTATSAGPKGAHINLKA
jgi:hypothetical protein